MAAACIALAGVAWSADTRAQERLELTWNAVKSCPPAAAVELEIERALSVVKGRSKVRVTADVTETKSAEAGAPELELKVRVEHAGEVGERTITAGNCDEVVRVTALFVALAVEIRESPPQRSQPASPKPRPKHRPWLLSAGPHIAAGLAPGVVGGFGLAFGFGGSWWRTELRASGFLPVERDLTGSQAGGEYVLASGGAFACGAMRFEPLALWTCLGARLARLQAEGRRATENFSRETYIGIGSVGLDLEWNFASPWLLRLGTEAGYAPRTSRFVIENVGLSHETDHVTGEGRLELAWTF